MGDTKGFGLGGKTTQRKGIPLMAKPEAGLKLRVSPQLAPQHKSSTSGAVPQNYGPLADTTATVNVRSESVAADTSGEPGANDCGIKNPALAEIKFPRCDTAVRKMVGNEWELADAILAECFETGKDGVRNKSYD